MKVVIISKNQNQYIKDFLNIFNVSDCLFVLDRQENVPKIKNLNFLINHQGSGFMAPLCRNIGTDYFPDEDILFIDGDRIPDKNPIPFIEKLKSDYSAIIFPLENDKRKWMLNAANGEMIKSIHIDDFMNNDFYSCAIFLRNDLIKKIKKINGGELFNKNFYGTWGDEDKFLGDEISYLKEKIGFCSEVKFKGEFNYTKEKHLDFIMNSSKRLELKCRLNNNEDISKLVLTRSYPLLLSTLPFEKIIKDASTII